MLGTFSFTKPLLYLLKITTLLLLISLSIYHCRSLQIATSDTMLTPFICITGLKDNHVSGDNRGPFLSFCCSVCPAPAVPPFSLMFVVHHGLLSSGAEHWSCKPGVVSSILTGGKLSYCLSCICLSPRDSPGLPCPAMATAGKRQRQRQGVKADAE